MSFKVMADNNIDIKASTDGAMNNVAMNNKDFIFGGIGDEMERTKSGLTVTVGTGEAIVHGRHIVAEEPNTINVPPNSSGYISIRIDLSQPSGFEASLKVVPVDGLIYEEINWDGNIYDFSIIYYVSNATEITRFDVRNVVRNTVSTKGVNFRYTLLASAWDDNTYLIDNSNIETNNTLLIIPPKYGDITEEALNQLRAADLMCLEQATYRLTLIARGEVPTVDIPIVVCVVEAN